MKSLSRPASRNQWLIPTRWVSAFHGGHFALGLAFSALLYLICLTGTLAVFVQELQRWEQPAAPLVTTVTPEAIQTGLEALLRQHPKNPKGTVSATLPSDAAPHLVLSTGAFESEAGSAWYADVTGRPVLLVRHNAVDFIKALHIRLLLPHLAGTMLVGLCGIAMLALILSGVAAHPRIFRDAFRLRRGGSALVQESDLHNRLGTWSLPFALIISLTGGFLGSIFILFSVAATTYKGDVMHAITDLVGPMAKDQPLPARIPSLRAMVGEIEALNPDMDLQSIDIQHPGTQGQLIAINMHSGKSIFLNERNVFDTNGTQIFSGNLTHRSVPYQMTWAIQPLHFGGYGGLYVKAGYSVMGLVLCVMTASGFNMWLSRRRAKGRPVPAWERLWAATIWGQPASLAFAAGTPLFLESAQAPAFAWVVASVTAYLIACCPVPAVRLQNWFRCAAAISMGALGIAHALRWAGSNLEMTSWAVDVTLVLGATLCLTLAPPSYQSDDR